MIFGKEPSARVAAGKGREGKEASGHSKLSGRAPATQGGWEANVLEAVRCTGLRAAFRGGPRLPGRGEVVASNRLRPDRINIMESLILAQNERWRRVLSMQVGRQGGAIFLRAADW